ncbi:MAG TPA: DUF2249 domain-containing protein [Longimicrobium sp.]|nr:DUF2249 domain-containing protein [Longimicrobium sp.]
MRRLDVRGIPPRDRFAVIMTAYQGLAPGQALELTVDHDPECMYFTLLGTRGAEAFSFEYAQRGPEVWRVSVTKLQEAEARAPSWS